jgi:hypothetical protein
MGTCRTLPRGAEDGPVYLVCLVFLFVWLNQIDQIIQINLPLSHLSRAAIPSLLRTAFPSCRLGLLHPEPRVL